MGSTVKILLDLNEMFLKIMKSWTENGHIRVTIIDLPVINIIHGDIFPAFMYCPFIYKYYIYNICSEMYTLLLLMEHKVDIHLAKT